MEELFIFGTIWTYLLVTSVQLLMWFIGQHYTVHITIEASLVNYTTVCEKMVA